MHPKNVQGDCSSSVAGQNINHSFRKHITVTGNGVWDIFRFMTSCPHCHSHCKRLLFCDHKPLAKVPPEKSMIQASTSIEKTQASRNSFQQPWYWLIRLIKQRPDFNFKGQSVSEGLVMCAMSDYVAVQNFTLQVDAFLFYNPHFRDYLRSSLEPYVLAHFEASDHQCVTPQCALWWEVWVGSAMRCAMLWCRWYGLLHFLWLDRYQLLRSGPLMPLTQRCLGHILIKFSYSKGVPHTHPGMHACSHPQLLKTLSQA